MIHKIQTVGSSYVAIEVKTVKWERCVCISKDASLVTLNYAETKQLNVIVQSIDAGNYVFKEYWFVKKWSEIYKVFLSEFRGIKSFQIRQWLVSQTYTGFGKLGISLPAYKIKELQIHMRSVLQEFEEIKA